MKAQFLLTLDKCLFPLRWMVEKAYFTLRASKTIPSNKNRLVVIKLMGMGSLVRAAHFIRYHRIDPSSILLITLRSQREIIDLLGWSNVVYLGRSPLDLIKILRAVRTFQPEWIVNLERNSNAASLFKMVLASWAGGQTRDYENRREDLALPLDTIISLSSLSRSFIEDGLLLGVGGTQQPDREKISPDKKKVIINVNASAYLLARRLPANTFLELVQHMHRHDQQLSFFFTGSREEQPYVENITAALTNRGIAVTNVAGYWSLAALAEELKSCALFITGDSGPLHLAAHLGAPTLSIWGPTSPTTFGYPHLPHVHHATLSLSCSPCFQFPKSRVAVTCRGAINCLHDFRAEDLAQRAIQLLLAESFEGQRNQSSRLNKVEHSR